MSARELVARIPQLKGTENLTVWRQQLNFALTALRLDKYIKKEVLQPAQAEAKETWIVDRATVNTYLHGTLMNPSVIQMMKAYGWDEMEEDPKVTYDTVIKALEGLGKESRRNMLHEFSSFKREQFATLWDFITRANLLRDEITKSGIKLDAAQELYNLLAALKDAYPEDHRLWEYRIDKEDMTWGTFMQVLYAKAQNEKHLNLAAVTKKNEESNKPAPKSNKKENKRGEKETCTTCSKEIGKGYKHHHCGKHIPPKATTCFWCEPEKAPDNWHFKAEATKQKTATAGVFRNGGNGVTQPPSENAPSTTHFHIRAPRTEPIITLAPSTSHSHGVGGCDHVLSTGELGSRGRWRTTSTILGGGGGSSGLTRFGALFLKSPSLNVMSV
ncbi:hypothetical protein B0T24DRAFT_723908 [Lasiosphaeria ovina]|uniref:Gag protein n=1 Tax=Lasiosphaeria ovina TaxID=92902 RepID=A0AAE0MZN8_9PEZI|nr:hypothetical protein B0T24DRAFT_723908 [Lasiosphaeria ovina]